MIKDNIGKGEMVIQYCPIGEMCTNINTNDLQESLFYKMCGRLMGIGEYYDDDIERWNTHPDLLHSQECAVNVSAKDISVLTRAGDISKSLAVDKAKFMNATKKTQSDVAALLPTITMA